MHPIEKLGWSVCADQMPADERREMVSVLTNLREGLRASSQIRLLCHVQMCLAVHETFRGDPEAARSSLDEALALVDPEADRVQFLSVLQVEGIWRLHAGDAARAVEAFVTMIRAADLPHIPLSLRLKARLNLAWALCCLGEHKSALRLCEESSELASASQDPRRRAEAMAVTLTILLDADELTAARALFARAAELPSDVRDARAQLLLEMAEARLLLLDGHVEDAGAMAERLLERDHAGSADDQILLCTLLATVSLQLDQLEQAERWCGRASEHISRAASGGRVAASMTTRARLLHRQGRMDAMFETIEQASQHAVAGSGRLLWETLEARMDELHTLREVELRATNDALRRLHRDEARARARAEAAAEARHLFLSSMSHEMRTPLTGVLGALSLVEKGVSPEEQQRLLGVARRSAGLTLQIIDDILDLGSLESGRMSLDVGAFELYRPIQDVLAMTAEQAAQAGVRVTTRVDPSLPCWVTGDVRRLIQVLLNLVANALKFAAGGHVEVRMERLDHEVRFSVIDDGIGIPHEVQDKLFQPFIQAGPAISRGFGGTGLGLSICRAIVQAFQGRIGVESEPGKGATFWFIIPLSEADPLVDEPSVEPGALPMERDLVGARVLLVEDNQVNRELGTLTLQMMGAEVLVAEDGVAAVQMVQNHPLDLILMDMHMPRMGGLAATRHLRAGGFDRPIVALTAAVLPEDRDAAVEAGMDAFATKPIHPTKLLEAIQQALRARDGAI